MKIRKKPMNPATKDRWKKLLPAIAAFAVVMIAASWLYAQASRTSTVEVYALSETSFVGEGQVFTAQELRTVEMPSDKVLLSTLVPASDGSFAAGVYTALKDLQPGALLQTSDYTPGEPAPEEPETQQPVEQPNWMIVSVPLNPVGLAFSEIEIRQGNIQMVTDQTPPRHIACIQYIADEAGSTGSNALIHPKDYVAISLWLEANRAMPVQQTSDECPIGEQPRLCGILTNALDPVDAYPDEVKDTGFVYVTETTTATVPTSGEGEENEPETAPVTTEVPLPICQSDNGAGVFDTPGKLSKEFCATINISYLDNVLGVDPAVLELCGASTEESSSNPDDPVEVLEDIEISQPDEPEVPAVEQADDTPPVEPAPATETSEPSAGENGEAQ